MTRSRGILVVYGIAILWVIFAIVSFIGANPNIGVTSIVVALIFCGFAWYIGQTKQVK